MINSNEALNKIWNKRKLFFSSLIFFFILGILYIILSPKEYRSEITLVVETKTLGSNISGLLQQFGGLVGDNLDKKEAEALSPDLYPEVVQSTPFLLEILHEKVIESKYDSILTVGQYLERHTHSSIKGAIYKYTLGLPGKIKEWIQDDKYATYKLSDLQFEADSLNDSTFCPIVLTKEESELVEALADCITTEVNIKKSNKFYISVELQDPLVVAQVTSYIVKHLTEYIIKYRTKKAKRDLEFVSARTIEAETKYLETQQSLANYKDQNKNVILSSVLSKEERLQSEYDLAYDVYKTLCEQLEQSKIKVQEETPVFNVVNPAQVPLKKDSPKTMTVIFLSLFLGAGFGIGIIFKKELFQDKFSFGKK